MEEQMTPPNSTNLQQLVASLTSTPQSRGLASQAESNIDYRAGQPKNIKLVEEELGNKQMANIIHFLKAFLSQVLSEHRGKEPGDEETRRESEEMFNIMLTDAISFCNDDGNSRLTEFMEHLKAYAAAKKETERYEPSSSMLNIVVEFRNKEYGPMPRPVLHNKKGIIFIPDDPKIVKLKHLCRELGPEEKAKRIPDVIGVFVSHLRRKYEEYRDYDLLALTREIAKGGIPKKVKREDEEMDEGDAPGTLCPAAKWKDIHLIWELKRKQSFDVSSWQGSEEKSLETCTAQASKTQATLNAQTIPNAPGSTSQNQPAAMRNNSASGNRAKGNLKRIRDADDATSEHSSKRSCVTIDSTSIIPSVKDTLEKLCKNPSPDVQCDYCGAERLAALFSITRGIVISPADTSLSLHWNDEQGCTQSHSFNFAKQLPVFVLMVMIFQRFTLRTLDLSQHDITKFEVENKTFLIEETPQLFQPFGRRTFGTLASFKPSTITGNSARMAPESVAPQEKQLKRHTMRGQLISMLEEETLVPPSLLSEHGDFFERDVETLDGSRGACEVTPDITSQPDEVVLGQEEDRKAMSENVTEGTSPDAEPFFFNSSRAENTRDKEFAIIETACVPAEEFPKDYTRMVTDHLPKADAAQACSSESTAVIRLLIKQAGRFENLSTEDIKKRGRVRIWMVSRRLRPITELEPDKFWKVFWDIVRCLYLLWKIGIAHGDVSLSNMMYYERDGELFGVLNDFDLAVIMKVGERSPTKRGLERTGTLPFMAIDLLESPNGEISRWFRHDLESCMWCLVWLALKEKRENWCCRKLSATSKIAFLMSFYKGLMKTEWEQYVYFLYHWQETCLDQRETRRRLTFWLRTAEEARKARQDADRKAKDADYMRPIAQATKELVKDKEVQALKDLTWIDLKMDVNTHPMTENKGSSNDELFINVAQGGVPESVL